MVRRARSPRARRVPRRRTPRPPSRSRTPRSSPIRGAPRASSSRARSHSNASVSRSGPPAWRARQFGDGASAAGEVLGRQVDATVGEVLGYVLAVLDELQRRADLIRERHARGRSLAEHAEHELADGVGRQLAVAAQLLPGLIPVDALVHAIGLDQAHERLARQLAFAQRRLQAFAAAGARPRRERPGRDPASSHPARPDDRRRRSRRARRPDGRSRTAASRCASQASPEQPAGHGEVLALRSRHDRPGCGEVHRWLGLVGRSLAAPGGRPRRWRGRDHAPLHRLAAAEPRQRPSAVIGKTSRYRW